MGKVDPNEAPEGYRAEKQPVEGHCIGCDLMQYLQDGHFTCPDWANCIGEERKDGQDVIFKKNITKENWGSMTPDPEAAQILEENLWDLV